MGLLSRLQGYPPTGRVAVVHVDDGEISVAEGRHVGFGDVRFRGEMRQDCDYLYRMTGTKRVADELRQRGLRQEAFWVERMGWCGTAVTTEAAHRIGLGSLAERMNSEHEARRLEREAARERIRKQQAEDAERVRARNAERYQRYAENRRQHEETYKYCKDAYLY